MRDQERQNVLLQVLEETLDAEAIAGEVLVAGDGSSEFVSTLKRPDRAVNDWSRRLGRASTAHPWLDVGTYDAAALRLPKSNTELEMSLHALASVLKAEGHLFVCGPNDEGIKSAGRRLAPLFDEVETVLAKRHCRVWRARRAPDITGLKGSLADWRSVIDMSIDGTVMQIVSYPGMFAHGRLDEGTALLLEALPLPPTDCHVVDFGCGAGVIAKALQRRQPELKLNLVDVDSVACEAARENVPDAQILLGTDLSVLGTGKADWIVSNPPVHSGKEQTFDVLTRLIVQSKDYLRRRGQLFLVTQRAVPTARLLGASFDAVEIIAEAPGYRVWRAVMP